MKNLALQMSDNGEPDETRQLRVESGIPAGGGESAVGLTIAEEVHAAWALDPSCLECGERIDSSGDAALLVTAGRVAHRDRCFVTALVRRNPLLTQLAAQKRAKEAQSRTGTRATGGDAPRG